MWMTSLLRVCLVQFISLIIREEAVRRNTSCLMQTSVRLISILNERMKIQFRKYLMKMFDSAICVISPVDVHLMNVKL